jgi:hypothetical protein
VAGRAAAVSAPSSQMVDGATLDEADLDETGLEEPVSGSGRSS